jgi:hypothetical protein
VFIFVKNRADQALPKKGEKNYMFKKYYLLAVVLVFAFGCNFSSGTKTEESKPPEEKEAAKFKVGDTVVAKWTGNSFYEGKIEKIENGKINVKWSDGSSATDIAESDVYTMPAEGSKPDVAVGDMVLAKVGSSSYWNGAEITKIEGDNYGVKTIENAKAAEVGANKIIKVSATTAASLKEKGGSTEFLKAAQAKKPEIPKNFKPKAGEKVLAEWTTNSWWSGKFQKTSGGKATIAWDDGSKPSEVGADKVMPLPKASNAKMPSENQYVIAKPASGSKWVYAQTVSIKDKSIEIKDSKGETRTVKAGEFVLLN